VSASPTAQDPIHCCGPMCRIPLPRVPRWRAHQPSVPKPTPCRGRGAAGQQPMAHHRHRSSHPTRGPSAPQPQRRIPPIPPRRARPAIRPEPDPDSTAWLYAARNPVRPPCCRRRNCSTRPSRSCRRTPPPAGHLPQHPLPTPPPGHQLCPHSAHRPTGYHRCRPERPWHPVRWDAPHGWRRAAGADPTCGWAGGAGANLRALEIPHDRATGPTSQTPREMSLPVGSRSGGRIRVREATRQDLWMRQLSMGTLSSR